MVSLVACALVFGGLARLDDVALATWDVQDVGWVGSLLHGVGGLGTIAVALLWAVQALRAGAAFLFGFVAGILLTAPLWTSLALEGRIPHLGS